MKRTNNFAREEKYTYDEVMNRANAIHSEWAAKKIPSRQIVNNVEAAVFAVEQDNELEAGVEALAYLIALDLRVKERYKSVIQRIFRYFSYRREKNALRRLKVTFDIDGNSDIRAAIEVELQNLRERVESSVIDDDDSDSTNGGKRNGISSQENPTTEATQSEVAEEKSEDSPEAEENLESTEEKTEEKSTEPTSAERTEAPKNEPAAEQPTTENTREQSTEPIFSKEEKQAEQTASSINNENNSSRDNQSKPLENNIDGNSQSKVIDIVPPLVFDDARATDNKAERSFIDQVIFDNIMKGRDDFITHNPWENDNPSIGENPIHLNDLANGASVSEAESEAFLYDQMLDANRVNIQIQESQMQESQIQENQVQKNNEQQNKASNNNAEPRVQIQVDIDNATENAYRLELFNSLSHEAMVAMVERMADVGREQLKIASADFDFEDPVEIIGFDENSNLIHKDAYKDVKK